MQRKALGMLIAGAFGLVGWFFAWSTGVFVLVTLVATVESASDKMVEADFPGVLWLLYGLGAPVMAIVMTYLTWHVYMGLVQKTLDRILASVMKRPLKAKA